MNNRRLLLNLNNDEDMKKPLIVDMYNRRLYCDDFDTLRSLIRINGSSDEELRRNRLLQIESVFDIRVYTASSGTVAVARLFPTGIEVIPVTASDNGMKLDTLYISFPDSIVELISLYTNYPEDTNIYKYYYSGGFYRHGPYDLLSFTGSLYDV